MENGKSNDLKFKAEEILEFSSKRKRMSVIVKNSKGEYVIYCKGADSFVFPLC